MEYYKILLIFNINFFVHLVKADEMDSAVIKSNIYYQLPLNGGKPHESTLDCIDEMPSKTDIKVIVHGFRRHRFHDDIAPLRNAYLAQGKENIFLADWRNAASFDYPKSRRAVAKVGVFLAKLLEKFLNKHKIPLTEVHIIGHSLGAHIAGNMGAYFNGTVGRVTGLDPALILFTSNAADSLKSNAALFVDVIHTDYPIFGDYTPRGTADFYPNYGYFPQNGCPNLNLVTISKLVFETYSCGHNRAVTYYAESIGLPQNFPAIPCSLTAIQNRSHKLCLQHIKDDSITKSSLAEDIAAKNDKVIVYMGEGARKSASGAYYLETFSVPPYGLGLFSQVH